MDSDISDRIAKLANLCRRQLLDLWKEVYGKPAPGRLRRELLVPFLAYRMQENFYGGLKPTVRSELRRIARGLEKGKGPGLVMRSRTRPGTRLEREWHGQTHEVVVTEHGFEYSGLSFRSLSEIARKITGTRCSGPAFFGLAKIERTASDD